MMNARHSSGRPQARAQEYMETRARAVSKPAIVLAFAVVVAGSAAQVGFDLWQTGT